MQNLRRTVKNVAYNYSDAQKAVREATSNNPWGPTTTQMVDIADYMKHPVAFNEVMSIIWKRLNDSGKNWRHVFKSLMLLDFLIKAGNDKVATLCKHNIYAIETLRDFQHIEEGRDQGIHIRDKARQLSALLGGQPIENGSGTTTSSDAVRNQPTARYRPTTAAEEAEQLRLAMELSMVEQQQINTQKDEFELAVQQALEESKKEAEELKAKVASKKDFEMTNGAPKSNVDDLLSLGDINMATQPSSSLAWYNTGLNDPWTPVAPEVPATNLTNYENTRKIPGIDVDPWSPSAQHVSPTPAPYSTYGLGNILPPSASSIGTTNGTHSYADPFSGVTYDSVVDYDKQNTSNLAASQSSKDFLGVGNPTVNVNSLIDLDNLTSSNPFLQPQRKNISMNEMRAQQQAFPTPPISPYPSSVPQSQIPISPNNPFASAF